MDLNSITVAAFKAYFTRDFPYLPPGSPSPPDPQFVSDADITKAFGEAQMAFNQGLFGDDNGITIAYLYLTAHFLCIDLRAALAGISGAGTFPVSGRSVGNVSENYMIPEAYSDDPYIAMFTATSYGVKYLTLLLPNLRGNVFAVFGGTNA